MAMAAAVHSLATQLLLSKQSLPVSDAQPTQQPYQQQISCLAAATPEPGSGWSKGRWSRELQVPATVAGTNLLPYIVCWSTCEYAHCILGHTYNPTGVTFTKIPSERDSTVPENVIGPRTQPVCIQTAPQIQYKGTLHVQKLN